MSIFVSRDILLVKKFIKHVCVYANKKKNAKRFIINHLAFFLVSLYSKSFILIRVRIKLRSCAERRRSSASAD